MTSVITLVDDRATKQAQAARLSQRAAELYPQIGCPVHGLYPLYKLIWLCEKQSQLFKQAARFISDKEYVTKQLTGDNLEDVGVAAGSALINSHTLEWNAASLELAGIRL